MRHFKEFINEKGRTAKSELDIVQKVLVAKGVKAVSRYDEEGEDSEPYVFVPTDGELSFGGLRIYKVGNHIAYRIQKEEDTQPFGRAYPLEIEEMYNDLVSDDMDENKAGKRVMEAIVGEIQRFLERSKKAERDLLSLKLDRSKFIIKGNVDYSSAVSHAKL